MCILTLVKVVLPDVFEVSFPLEGGEEFLSVNVTRNSWVNVAPRWKLDIPDESTYSIYSLLGWVIIFYLIKVRMVPDSGCSNACSSQH